MSLFDICSCLIIIKYKKKIIYFSDEGTKCFTHKLIKMIH